VQSTGLDPSDPACATTAAIAPVVYADLVTGTFSCTLAGVGNDAYATVYTYITQASVGCNTATANGFTSCSNGTGIAGDARRVIVAALLNTTDVNHPNPGSLTHGPEYPTYVSTVITNPVPSNQANQVNGLRIGVSLG
jgi:hypothetical protein